MWNILCTSLENWNKFMVSELFSEDDSVLESQIWMSFQGDLSAGNLMAVKGKVDVPAD